MGKKSKPPPPPDYTALAKQQADLAKTAATEQTATNRPDQNTAFGSTAWTQDPAGKWTQNVTLNPEDQKLLDQQRQFQGQQQGIASGLLGRAGETMGQDLNFEGLPQPEGYDTSKLGNFGSIDSSKFGDWGSMDPSKLSGFGSMDPSQLMDYQGFGDAKRPDLVTSAAGSTGSGFNMGNAPELADIDMSKLQSGFGAVESVRDAMMGRMAPQRQYAREAEIQRLKNQGITENSEAWTRALTRLDQGDTDAQQQALLGAAGEYGNIFNRELAGQQAYTGNRRANRGQLSNEANYAAQDSRENARMANEMSMGNAHLANSARSQDYNERMGLSQESRAARGQQFGEQQALANFQNNIRGQQFGEQGATANFANMVRGQQFDEQNAAANMANQTRSQQFGEQGAQANLAGALRQQGISERQMQRDAPLNDFMKLTSGINPTNPNMPSFMSGTGYNAADIYGAGKDQYGAAMNQYNAAQARKGGMMSGLMGLAGTALGGPLGGMLGNALGGSLPK